jgi:hypothetical protein
VDAELAVVPAATADAIRARGQREAGRRDRHDDNARPRNRRPGLGRRALSTAPPICSFTRATFRAVDALVTNFHLPRSSLLMLVAAFAGWIDARGISRCGGPAVSLLPYGDVMIVIQSGTGARTPGTRGPGTRFRWLSSSVRASRSACARWSCKERGEASEAKPRSWSPRP